MTQKQKDAVKVLNKIKELSEEDYMTILEAIVDNSATFDDFDYNGKVYNPQWREIQKGDTVIRVDPETRIRTMYEVYEEPSSEMVKLRNKYEKCEALLEECFVVSSQEDIFREEVHPSIEKEVDEYLKEHLDEFYFTDYTTMESFINVDNLKKVLNDYEQQR